MILAQQQRARRLFGMRTRAKTRFERTFPAAPQRTPCHAAGANLRAIAASDSSSVATDRRAPTECGIATSVLEVPSPNFRTARWRWKRRPSNAPRCHNFIAHFTQYVTHYVAELPDGTINAMSGAWQF